MTSTSPKHAADESPECPPAKKQKPDNTPQPKLKLIYFAGMAGRCDHIRTVMAVCGIPHEFEGLDYNNWSNDKPRFPFLKVPVLCVDDKMYAESLAILHYVCTVGKLHEKLTAEEKLESSMIAHLGEDILSEIYKIYSDKSLDKEAWAKTTKDNLTRFDSLLQKYKKGSEYLLSSVSMADFYVANLFIQLITPGVETLVEGAEDLFPNMAKVFESIENLKKEKGVKLEMSKVTSKTEDKVKSEVEDKDKTQDKDITEDKDKVKADPALKDKTEDKDKVKTDAEDKVAGKDVLENKENQTTCEEACSSCII